MTFEELKALDHQYTMQTYGRFDVALDHGKGATLYGLEGEVYTDFASGIGVASLGYGHPAWVKAVSEQAQKLQHASNLFYTERCHPFAAAQLADEDLTVDFSTETTPQDKVAVIVTAPLTKNETWTQFEKGVVNVFVDGRLYLGQSHSKS